MNKKELSFALIGAGGIGKIWAGALLTTPQVDLKYVVDVDESKASEMASQFSRCSTESSWEKIVNTDGVDAVIVATPHKALAPISRAFLNNKKHVLCEKPGAIDAQSLYENSEIASEMGLVYMIGFNHRFHKAFIEAKRRLDEGEIGEPLFIRARYGFGERPDYEKEWRLNKEISGGGELLDQGVHMIDLARWFLGEFVDVKGFAEKMYWQGDVEDNGFALLRTKDHRVASIHVSWTQWDWIHSFEIIGTKGYLLINGLDKRYGGPERLTVGVHDPRGGKFPEQSIIEYKEEEKESSFVRQLEAFLGAINGDGRDIPTGMDGGKALAVIEEIYRQS